MRLMRPSYTTRVTGPREGPLGPNEAREEPRQATTSLYGVSGVQYADDPPTRIFTLHNQNLLQEDPSRLIWLLLKS